MPTELNNPTIPSKKRRQTQPLLLMEPVASDLSDRHLAEIGRLCAELGWQPCVVTADALETGQPERFIRPG